MPRATDRAWKSYSERFRREIVPSLLSSAAFVALYDEGDGGDAEIKFATEIGLMLLYDKPILLAYRPGNRPAEPLCRAAAEVVEYEPGAPASEAALVAALHRIAALHGD